MIWLRWMAAIAAMALLAGCEPGGSSAPAGVDQAKYERHKANREAYLYQGL